MNEEPRIECDYCGRWIPASQFSPIKETTCLQCCKDLYDDSEMEWDDDEEEDADDYLRDEDYE